MKNKRTIFVIIAAVLIVIAATLGILDFCKNAYLSVLVAPLDSSIYINGKEYANGTYRLFPGEVSVKIEREGMEAQEFQIGLESHKTTTLYIFLSGADNDFSYYETSLADYEALKIIVLSSEDSDSAAEQFAEKTEQILSISDALSISSFTSNDTLSPVNGQLGWETIIKDGTDNEACKKLICLQILDNTGSTDSAKELLSKYGYNFDDYQVIEEAYSD